MPIKELKLNLGGAHVAVEVVGRREILSSSVEGSWATTFKGRGMEFTGFRQYTYSDDASAIDWRASLRSKQLLVREYEEFKNFRVVFLVDVSDGMLFTTTEQLKAEYAADLAYRLCESALQSGDAVGMSLFSDKVHGWVEPGFGRGMQVRFRRSFMDGKNYGGTRDIKRSILEINSMIGDPAIIVIISDFIGLPPDWERYLSLLAHHHQVLGIMIKDERDMSLPKNAGQYALKDPVSNETMYADINKFRKEYETIGKEHEVYVRSVFKKFMGDCQLVVNGTNPRFALQKFFNSQKKLLR